MRASVRGTSNARPSAAQVTETGDPGFYLLRLVPRRNLMLLRCSGIETASRHRRGNGRVFVCSPAVGEQVELELSRLGGPRTRGAAGRQVQGLVCLSPSSLWGENHVRKPPAWGIARGVRSATRRVSPPALGKGSTHKHTEKRQARGPVLLRPPRRRPEHRSSKLIPRNSRIPVGVQRIYSRPNVVHVGHAEDLGELLVVP